MKKREIFYKMWEHRRQIVLKRTSRGLNGFKPSCKKMTEMLINGFKWC